MIDPYLIPGTDTLRNIPGLTDAAALAELESAVSHQRIYQLEEGTKLAGRWDLAHLQAVHRHIFQDVYDWAGQIRTIAMSKGEDFHPLPNLAYGHSIFDRLATDKHLRGLDRQAFVSKVSQFQSELFALHPFREGNTRSTTTFVSLLARQAGWHISWRDAGQQEMQEALRASYRAPEQIAGKELEAIVGSVTTPVSAVDDRSSARSGQGAAERPRRRRSSSTGQRHHAVDRDEPHRDIGAIERD